ncbi:serine protease family S33 [Thraustotheca clavata]|uniref:Serine protease family S33 n=1 Tax=Thraustotheca clavata TaxID=74557 RepID=A0A1V9ZMW7_9STRA|nr:serine protease family S33 [Thraustotheca clavata]
MTIEHRGTGRSSLLAYTAAQAMTPGSPDGPKFAIEELLDCLRDNNYTLINHSNRCKLHNSFPEFIYVYIYGVSYGNFWVERVIAIQNQNSQSGRNIRGYIPDGVVPHSGNHDWDRTMSVVGWTYLGLRNKDTFCRSKFSKSTLQSTTLALYANLSNKSARCFINAGVDDLKELFGVLLMGSALRLLIPVMILTYLHEHGYIGAQESNGWSYDSEILHSTIAFSELWPSNSPSYSSMKKQFDYGVMGLREYLQFPEYCIYSGFKILDYQPYQISVSFTYPLDKYAFQRFCYLWTDSFGRRKRSSFLGQRKKLIKFSHAVHAISYTTWTYPSVEFMQRRKTHLVLENDDMWSRLNYERCVAQFRFQLSTKFGQLLAPIDDLLTNITESTFTPSPTTIPFDLIENTTFNTPETMAPSADSWVYAPVPTNTSVVLSSSPNTNTPSSSSLGYSLAGLMTCLFVVAVLVAIKYYREAKAISSRYAAFQEEG